MQRKIEIVPKYSIVVPFHNEEENVTQLYDRVKDVMEQVGASFEMVFVDDGSRDRTYRLLEEIAAVDSRVLVVKLRRNFGQTSALAAGFDHCAGRVHPGDGWRPAARSGGDSDVPGEAGRRLRRGERMARAAGGQHAAAADSFARGELADGEAVAAWISTTSGRRSRRIGAR